MDVDDDGQRILRVLWSQDTQSYLRTWAVFDREILDVDRQLAHLSRLCLVEGDSSFFGTKFEQQG